VSVDCHRIYDMGYEENKMSHMSEKAIDEMNELNNLRTENAVLRGVNEVLRSLVHDKFKTNEWNCAGIPKWEGFKQDDWKTGDTKEFLGLTDAEVDTLDKWMEEGKDKQ
jgi:hypothetical protein